MVKSHTGAHWNVQERALFQSGAGMRVHINALKTLVCQRAVSIWCSNKQCGSTYRSSTMAAAGDAESMLHHVAIVRVASACSKVSRAEQYS